MKELVTEVELEVALLGIITYCFPSLNGHDNNLPALTLVEKFPFFKIITSLHALARFLFSKKLRSLDIISYIYIITWTLSIFALGSVLRNEPRLYTKVCSPSLPQGYGNCQNVFKWGIKVDQRCIHLDQFEFFFFYLYMLFFYHFPFFVAWKKYNR